MDQPNFLEKEDLKLNSVIKIVSTLSDIKIVIVSKDNSH